MLTNDRKHTPADKQFQRTAFMKDLQKPHESLQQQISSLELANTDILRRLIQICMFKDNEIGNHILRVGAISRFLADNAGTTPEQAYFIGIAAPMHDIGKIGIPDSILYKPGAITPNEYEILKTHTLIGANIFTNPNSPEIEYARQVALYHHERWDGQGYPHGLSEEAIPFAARVTAVADVFDELLSWRMYKEPISEANAAKIITRNKGGQFDPLVVEAFSENLEEICHIRNTMMNKADNLWEQYPYHNN